MRNDFYFGEEVRDGSPFEALLFNNIWKRAPFFYIWKRAFWHKKRGEGNTIREEEKRSFANVEAKKKIFF